ncbi:RNA recognition motif domain-containing protein [Vulcanococcus limneticus]|uniref:RNA recognition motif domain-containing protein n=1 Tax=Vulcanococcus limneticus TaxID=2170428 RepID=UPI001E39040C|nr:RNA-binding protein [Vulcanococcus limneticus]
MVLAEVVSTTTLLWPSSPGGEFQGLRAPVDHQSGSDFLQIFQRIRVISLVQLITLFVGNLSCDAVVEDFQRLFAEYGSVCKCSLPLDRDTGRKRGFAFIEIADANDETKVIRDLQDGEWVGRTIRVN